MSSTTIALSKEVYKETLDAKQHLEKEVGRSMSFSDAVHFMYETCKKNKKW